MPEANRASKAAGSLNLKKLTMQYYCSSVFSVSREVSEGNWPPAHFETGEMKRSGSCNTYFGTNKFILSFLGAAYKKLAQKGRMEEVKTQKWYIMGGMLNP